MFGNGIPYNLATFIPGRTRIQSANSCPYLEDIFFSLAILKKLLNTAVFEFRAFKAEVIKVSIRLESVIPCQPSKSRKNCTVLWYL